MQAQKAPQETTILPSAARIMAQQAQQAQQLASPSAEGGGTLRLRPLVGQPPRSTSPSQPFVATSLPAERVSPPNTLPPELAMTQPRQKGGAGAAAAAAFVAAQRPEGPALTSQQPEGPNLFGTMPSPRTPLGAGSLGRTTAVQGSAKGGHFGQLSEAASAVSSARARSDYDESIASSQGGGPSSSNMPVIVTLPASILYSGAAQVKPPPPVPKPPLVPKRA